jgi:ribosomal-protein-alanine N-acetyltransferase
MFDAASLEESVLDKAMTVMDTAFDPQWGEAWTKSQLAGSLMSPGTALFLINSGGKPAAPDETADGFLLSRTVADESELLLIGVRPPARSTGLGTILIEQFLDFARAQGANTAFLEMRSNNPAITLYKRLGFVPMGLRKGYYKAQNGDRIDAITFRKSPIKSVHVQ